MLEAAKTWSPSRRQRVISIQRSGSLLSLSSGASMSSSSRALPTRSSAEAQLAGQASPPPPALSRSASPFASAAGSARSTVSAVRLGSFQFAIG
jgi:hypothetical protein